MTKPRSICILRLSAIGDVTHVLPVVHTIREQLAGAQITWVIGKLEKNLVADLPGVEFVVFDKSEGRKAYQQLRASLHSRKFDALLHMQVALRANLAAAVIRAKQRIGYDRARSKDLHGLFVNERIRAAPNQHVLDCLGSFLEPIGLKQNTIRWDIPLSDSDRAFATQHVNKDRRTMVVAPVSSHKLRNWMPDRYAAVADHAIEHHGMQVILSGGPGSFEREFGNAVKAAMKHTPNDLIGQDTLKQSAALLGAADIVLCPDTGPMHVANAMGTEVLGLHAASNPQRSGAYSSLKWTVDRYDDAAKKFLGKPASEIKWGTKIEYPGVMELITVDDVVERLDAWADTRRDP